MHNAHPRTRTHKDLLVTVLDENEGDIEKTMEMFMPVNPAVREEHQKRPDRFAFVYCLLSSFHCISCFISNLFAIMH